MPLLHDLRVLVCVTVNFLIQFVDGDQSEWDKMVAVNVWGALNLTRAGQANLYLLYLSIQLYTNMNQNCPFLRREGESRDIYSGNFLQILSKLKNRDEFEGGLLEERKGMGGKEEKRKERDKTL